MDKCRVIQGFTWCKKKRHAILFSGLTIALFSVYQNCGSQQAPSGGATTAPLNAPDQATNTPLPFGSGSPSEPSPLPIGGEYYSFAHAISTNSSILSGGSTINLFAGLTTIDQSDFLPNNFHYHHAQCADCVHIDFNFDGTMVVGEIYLPPSFIAIIPQNSTPRVLFSGVTPSIDDSSGTPSYSTYNFGVFPYLPYGGDNILQIIGNI